MSFQVVPYSPDQRAALVALLARVGTTQLSDEEFAWWFDRNPAGEGIVSLAVDGGEVVGVAAMSFFRTMLNGVETRLAIPVNVATDPRYRGQGVFSTFERENETAAAASGSPLTVTFPNGASYPIFMSRLGWIDLPRLRLWARPLRVSVQSFGTRSEGAGERGGAESVGCKAAARSAASRFGSSSASAPELDALGRRAAPATESTSSRDAAVLQLAVPRLASGLSVLRGVSRTDELAGAAVVGHTFKHGVSAGFLADLVAAPEEISADQALALTGRRGGAGAAQTRSCSFRLAHGRIGVRCSGRLRATNKKLRFIGKALHERPASTSGRRVALLARRLRLLLMPKLVFITQQVDPGHPALAATVPKIRALAELVDEVVVLADGAVDGVLPTNCRVRTFRARHTGPARRAFRGCPRARARRASGEERSSRTCARSMRFSPPSRAAASRAARPLVHALARERALAGGRARLDRDHVGRQALVSASLEEAAARSGTASTSTSSRARPPAMAEGRGSSRSVATRRRRASTGWSRGAARGC